jgi:hypothetical protein
MYVNHTIVWIKGRHESARSLSPSWGFEPSETLVRSRPPTGERREPRCYERRGVAHAAASVVGL